MSHIPIKKINQLELTRKYYQNCFSTLDRFRTDPAKTWGSGLPHRSLHYITWNSALYIYQWNLKGESIVAAILPLRMEVSHCSSGFFLQLSPPNNSVKCELPFPRGLRSPTHIGYCAANHKVVMMCADCSEWSCQTVCKLRKKIWASAGCPVHEIWTSAKDFGYP